MIHCKSLGQSGFRLAYRNTVIFIDPYLSDSVEKLEGKLLRRQFPVKLSPQKITDADYVLITHIHLDHCDLESLKPIAESSPDCLFICPNEVSKYLSEQGFSKSRLISLSDHPVSIKDNIQIQPVPAAHPVIERDAEGMLKYLGYILDFDGQKIYHAGDTFVVKELIEFLSSLQPFHTVMLPVNEHNYFKQEKNILGNMTLREAFGLAERIRAPKMVPIHWDMFIPNAVSRKEIELVYLELKPDFELLFYPELL